MSANGRIEVTRTQACFTSHEDGKRVDLAGKRTMQKTFTV